MKVGKILLQFNRDALHPETKHARVDSDSCRKTLYLPPAWVARGPTGKSSNKSQQTGLEPA